MKSQDADTDIREEGRESDYFINKKDGQWEPEIITRMKGRPRYTLDRVGPIVDQIAGEMEEASFTIEVTPTNAIGTKDTAETYEGLIRNIVNMSNASHVFNQANRGMVTTGMDGWEVIQDYSDSDTFDQDLIIKKVPNFNDRVWYSTNSLEQDKSDAWGVWVLQTVTKDEYESRWPEGSGTSIGTDRIDTVYYHKPDFITIAKFMYKKREDIELIQMNNGSVYRDDDDFKKVKKELKQQGVVETGRRKRKSWRVHSRLMDGQGWLTDEEKTVFDWLPVVAQFGNYRVSEDKVIWRGEVLKLMDPQRIYNYTRSRQVEEVALSPRAKYWMSPEQARGHTDKLATMNTNADPVQLFNPDPNNPGVPQQNGGSQVNQGAEILAQTVAGDIGAIANQFDAQMGNNQGLQSGVAIQQQVSQGNIGSIKYFNAHALALCYTYRVLLGAIPRVYDATRQVRLLSDDGQVDIITLNEPVVDQETGETIELNDLSKGQYDATCEVGQAFRNRQEEGNAAMIALAQADPSILALSQDQLIKNMGFPGADDISERARSMMIKQGIIPQEQLTEEELAKAQQDAQQQPQGDPAMMIAAQAEMQKAQAQTQEAGNKTAALEIDAAKVQLEMQRFQAEQDGKLGVEGAKLEQEQQRIDLDAQAQQFNQMLAAQKADMDTLKQEFANIKTNAETLKTLKDATGAEAIMSNEVNEAYQEQAEIIQDSQDDVD